MRAAGGGGKEKGARLASRESFAERAPEAISKRVGGPRPAFTCRQRRGQRVRGCIVGGRSGRRERECVRVSGDLPGGGRSGGRGGRGTRRPGSPPRRTLRPRTRRARRSGSDGIGGQERTGARRRAGGAAHRKSGGARGTGRGAAGAGRTPQPGATPQPCARRRRGGGVFAVAVGACPSACAAVCGSSGGCESGWGAAPPGGGELRVDEDGDPGAVAGAGGVEAGVVGLGPGWEAGGGRRIFSGARATTAQPSAGGRAGRSAWRRRRGLGASAARVRRGWAHRGDAGEGEGEGERVRSWVQQACRRREIERRAAPVSAGAAPPVAEAEGRRGVRAAVTGRAEVPVLLVHDSEVVRIVVASDAVWYVFAGMGPLLSARTSSM